MNVALETNCVAVLIKARCLGPTRHQNRDTKRCPSWDKNITWVSFLKRNKATQCAVNLIREPGSFQASPKDRSPIQKRGSPFRHLFTSR